MSKEPDAKRVKFCGAFFETRRPPLQLIVGKKERVFYFDRRVICSHSEFIKNKCDFLDNTVRLSDVDDVIFSLFLTWILTGDISNAEEYIQVSGNEKEKKSKHNLQWAQLAKCFILGEKLKAEKFSNDIINSTIENMKQFFVRYKPLVGASATQISLVWITSQVDSALRRVILDSYVSSRLTLKKKNDDVKIWYDELMQESDTATIEFLIQAFDIVADACQSNRKDKVSRPWEGDICRYHTHNVFPKGYSCSAGTGKKGTT